MIADRGREDEPRTRRLSTPAYLGYGVGSIGTGIFSTVPGLLLLYFMTDTLGVAAGLAGIACAIPKIWDLVADPLVGAVSDGTASRWGRRRPYLLAGGVLLPLFFAMLFCVPVFRSPTSSFLYVLVVFLFAATAYSVFQVPYIAMPAEMTQDYHERTTIMSYRMVLMSVGILIGGAAAPLLIDRAGGGRRGYALMSVVIAGICMAAMIGTFFGTRSVPRLERVEASVPFREQLRLALRNRPFFVLLLGYTPQLIGVSCTLSVVPYFAKYILGGSGMMVTTIFACLVVPAIVVMPLWARTSRRIGKLRAYRISAALFAVLGFTLLAGSPAHTGLLYLQVALMGAAYAGTQLFPLSMLPDAIQADHARSGLRREGIFTGVWTAVEKTGMAFGALAAGEVLSWTGFVESEAGAVVAQPPSALKGIRVALAVVPPLLFLASLPILGRYDLTEERLVDLALEERVVPSSDP